MTQRKEGAASGDAESVTAILRHPFDEWGAAFDMLKRGQFLRRAASIAALAITAATSSTAMAVPLKFTLNNGDFSGSWIQDSNPVPLNSQESVVTDISIQNPSGSASGANAVRFTSPWYSQTYMGGNGNSIDLILFFGNGPTRIFDVASSVYSGGETSPQFSIGTFATHTFLGAGTGTLRIAPTAPAPLAGAGLFAALATMLGWLATRGRNPFDTTSLVRKLKMPRFA